MKFARVSMFVLVALAGAFVLTGERPAAGQSRGPAGNPNFAAQPPADPELAKLLEEESALNEDIRELVGDYARTQDEGKRAAIKAKLSPVIDKQFDLQQKRRELEVTRLEAQIKKVREMMKKRADTRPTIVEKRLDQILREAEGLGWTDGPGGRER
jgi:hypothetical protein